MGEKGINLFDQIVYINLDHRKDRKKSILSELGRLGADRAKVYRLSAHYDLLNGTRGCVISHIKALDLAKTRGWNHFLILEDDCLFAEEERKVEALIQLFFSLDLPSWDVFLLGGRVDLYEKTPWPYLIRILKSQRAHAYAVSSTYISSLRNCYAKALQSMEGDLFSAQSYFKALDYAWMPLQQEGHWYGGLESLARQAVSFSDVEQRICERKEEQYRL
jgi:GR25 family glycosyltransferase involved in LPS biosynthesis